MIGRNLNDVLARTAGGSVVTMTDVQKAVKYRYVVIPTIERNPANQQSGRSPRYKKSTVNSPGNAAEVIKHVYWGLAGPRAQKEAEPWSPEPSLGQNSSIDDQIR
jgi:hypothetical protein